MESTERNEYNPSTQWIARNVSTLIRILLIAAGGPFFVVPSWYHMDNEAICMARLLGGLLLTLATTSIQNDLSALCTFSVLGLMMVLTGVWNEITTNNSSQENNFSWAVMGEGLLFLVLACIGLMALFWPKSTRTPAVGNDTLTEALLLDRDEEDAEERPRVFCTQQPDSLTEPLLSDHDNTVPDTAAPAEDPPSTSRIVGTTRLLKLAAPQVGYLYLGCIVLFIRLPFSLSIPHFVSTTLGALGLGDYAGARTEIMLLFIMGTIDAALDFWCVFLFGYARERIIRSLRVDTFASILRQETAFFDATTSGELSSRLSSDCGEMAGDLTWFMRFSIESVVRITGITIYMLVRCPTLGGSALCIVPVVAMVNKVYGNFLRNNAIQVQTALAQANSVAQEAFICIRTVIAFATEDFEYQKYRDKIEDQYRLKIRELFLSGVYYMVISTFLINTCIQAALLFIGTRLIERGSLTPQILLAFMLYQGQLQNETMNLFNAYSSLVKSSGAGDQVFQLLDRIPPLPGTGNPQVAANNSATTLQQHASQSSVELSNVWFNYPTRPSDQPVLKGLNLKIPPGSTLALVGPSGSGKSTVISLLQRFYDPTSGNILINSINLKGTNLNYYRRHCLGVVTQNPILFSGSIHCNVTYGNDSNDILDATRMAHAHEFIMAFPDGYDTSVGERGDALSGGQKQRIAIARAMAKHPSLLLLDEATSALDAESQHLVQEALEKWRERDHMTTIIVAHRLQTVRHADCIAFMEGGQVVEQGTYEELMALNQGHFRAMVSRAGDTGVLPED